MSLSEIFVGAYGWLDANAMTVFLICLGVPAVGTALAWVGKGGKTDRDGRLAANVMLLFAFAVFVGLILGVAVAHWGFDQGLLSANVLLLLAPLAALGLGLGGAHLVFPLSELASARSARDIGLFAVAILAVFWLFSQFRGWGIVFFGSIAQMVVIGGLIALFVRRLYRRAFKGGAAS